MLRATSKGKLTKRLRKLNSLMWIFLLGIPAAHGNDVLSLQLDREPTVQVVGETFLGLKTMDLEIRDRKFSPDFTTAGLSVGAIFSGACRVGANLEWSVKDDIITDQNGLVFFSRSDASAEVGCRVFDWLSGFVGYRVGQTDAHYSTTNDAFDTSESGFYLGGGVAYNFGQKGDLAIRIAIASLDGEVSLREPFVDTSAFLVGPMQPENIQGDAVGFNVGIHWEGRLSQNTGYTLGARIHRYEFEDTVVFGGVDLTYQQDFISVSAGVVHRF